MHGFIYVKFLIIKYSVNKKSNNYYDVAFESDTERMKALGLNN